MAYSNVNVTFAGCLMSQSRNVTLAFVLVIKTKDKNKQLARNDNIENLLGTVQCLN